LALRVLEVILVPKALQVLKDIKDPWALKVK
jgi:hypothetical protein